jgi:hypothetical protein
MRVQVDVELLRATAPPLRQASAVVDDLRGMRQSGSEPVAGHVGDQTLGRAIDGFLTAWSDQLDAAGQRGRALAGMLERAAEHYAHTEHHVHGQAKQAQS